MERFKQVKILGDGSFGVVILAEVIETNEKVAIKKMKKKYKTWDECVQLREIKSLRKLHHKNIIKLKEVIREHSSDDLYFIFEYMQGNLYELLQAVGSSSYYGGAFNESQVKFLALQLLEGIDYMHQNGFFHRDLKPENVLVSALPTAVSKLPVESIVLKLADFGQARQIQSVPPYTDYISTRWYRAPELLLRSVEYTPAIDIWAFGCILYEMYTMKPLFPGTTELDQLFKICAVLGSPESPVSNLNQWKEGLQLASKINFTFPQVNPVNFFKLAPKASSAFLEVIKETIMWDPSKRMTPQLLMQHSFFKNVSVVNESNSTVALENTGRFSIKLKPEGSSSQKPLLENEHQNVKPSTGYKSYLSKELSHFSAKPEDTEGSSFTRTKDNFQPSPVYEHLYKTEDVKWANFNKTKLISIEKGHGHHLSLNIFKTKHPSSTQNYSFTLQSNKKPTHYPALNNLLSELNQESHLSEDQEVMFLLKPTLERQQSLYYHPTVDHQTLAYQKRNFKQEKQCSKKPDDLVLYPQDQDISPSTQTNISHPPWLNSSRNRKVSLVSQPTSNSSSPTILRSNTDFSFIESSNIIPNKKQPQQITPAKNESFNPKHVQLPTWLQTRNTV